MPGIYSPTHRCESSGPLYQFRATLRCDRRLRAAMWLRFSWTCAKPENTPWLGSLLSQLTLSLLLHLSGLSRAFPLTNCLDKSFCLRVCFRRTQNSPAEPLGIPDSWKPWEIIKWLLFKPSFGVIWYAAMSSQNSLQCHSRYIYRRDFFSPSSQGSMANKIRQIHIPNMGFPFLPLGLH